MTRDPALVGWSAGIDEIEDIDNRELGRMGHVSIEIDADQVDTWCREEPDSCTESQKLQEND